jgi:hypothetical protein
MSGTLLGYAYVRIRPSVDPRSFERKTSRGVAAPMAKVAAGIAAAFAATGVSSFLKSTVSQASDLSETVNKANVIFGRNAAEIQKWSQGAARNFGLSKGAALEAAAAASTTPSSS